MTLTATVEKEWAEVRRKGRGKVEDWSWTVSFFADRMIDQHYINNEPDAKLQAILFETGNFTIGEYNEVQFTKAFE